MTKLSILLTASVLALGLSSPVGCGDDETTGRTDLSAVADLRIDILLDFQPESEPDLQPDTEPDVEPDLEPDIAPDVEPDLQPDAEFDIEPDLQPDAELDIEPDVEPMAIAVSFAIDDTAEERYTGNLAWMGSFSYDSVSNTISFDAGWSGPYVPLWDDGPVADGGHEPAGATAGDHIWSAVVLVEVTSSEQRFEYGALQNYTPGDTPSSGTFVGEWIWPYAENGSFTVAANATEDIAIETLVLAYFGWINARFSLDTLDLDSDFADPGTITSVQVMSSAWGWTRLEMVDDGTQDDTGADGVYSFSIGDNLGEGRPANAPGLGLLLPGQDAQFVFGINNIAYKIAGIAAEQGVTAELWIDGAWAEQTVAVNEASNTFITILDGWIPVSFTVDDTANQTYGSTCAVENPTCDGLAWKGSFAYDHSSRTMVFDGSWSGPYALVHDDGPWNEGGHEPVDATAGDHVWGITAWVDVTGAQQDFGYGAIRFYEEGAPSSSTDLWIWLGDNGSFSVAADQTEAISVTGLAIPAFDGSVDLLIELDTNNLATGWTFDSGSDTLSIKGSAWGWDLVDMRDDGADGDVTANDGRYVFELSTDGSIHDDLLNIDEEVFFSFFLNGMEYKEGGNGLADGVSAWSDHNTAGVYDVLEVFAGSGDTSVIIGRCPDGDSDTVCDDDDVCEGQDDLIDVDANLTPDCSENELTNTEFDVNIDGWMAASPSVTVSWDDRDADRNADSGSIKVDNACEHPTSTCYYGARGVCLTVAAGKTYDLYVEYFIESGQSANGVAMITVVYSKGTNCEGGATYFNGSDSSVDNVVDAWTTLSLSDITPADTQSLYVSLKTGNPTDGDSFWVLFDNVLMRVNP